MTKRISAFVEDQAHRLVIGALIERVADECDIAVKVEWRNARRGYGRVVKEFSEYLRDLKRQGNLPDFIVVGTDANCKGRKARSQQLPVNESPVPVVLAIPDPHVERWLLLDGAAFETVFGKGCAAPDKKCARSRYKERLIQAIAAAGVTPGPGGIEFAGDLVREMDLRRVKQLDVSLGRFLDDLDGQLKR